METLIRRRSDASDLGLHCMPLSGIKDARLIWVKTKQKCNHQFIDSFSLFHSSVLSPSLWEESRHDDWNIVYWESLNLQDGRQYHCWKQCMGQLLCKPRTLSSFSNPRQWTCWGHVTSLGTKTGDQRSHVRQWHRPKSLRPFLSKYTGGKPRNYHEIVLT